MSNHKGKIDIRMILGIILAIALIYLLVSGKLNLFGGTMHESSGSETMAQIPLVTGQAAASSGNAQTQSSTAKAAGDKTTAAKTTAAPKTTAASQGGASHVARKDYYFRNKSLLNGHYDKHGREMGFKNAKEYEAAASAVINNPAALYKTEKEDGDHVFYIEATNEFVVLSKDGYIRTYFKPDGGKRYFDRQ